MPFSTAGEGSRGSRSEGSSSSECRTCNLASTCTQPPASSIDFRSAEFPTTLQEDSKNRRCRADWQAPLSGEVQTSEEMALCFVGSRMLLLQRDLHHLAWILVDLKKKQFAHLDVIACAMEAFILPYMALKMRRSSVAAGSYHTCAITAGGQLNIFGDTFREYTDYGQRKVPCGLGRVLSVSAGNCHTCAVKVNGELVCFGHDYAGQCRIPSNLGPVVAVSAGRDHTCAVRASGELVCFGGNRYGQCDIPANLGPVVAVAAGMHHTCTIRADGQVVCFGDNEYGQCTVPTDLHGVTAVAAGAFHTLVIADGAVSCFGLQDDGQCEVPRGLGPAVAVAAGALHSCVLLRSGNLACFGSNLYGQCAVPRNLGPVVAVAAGESMTCAVTEDLKLVCFGRHKHGQCNVPSDLGPVHIPERGADCLSLSCTGFESSLLSISRPRLPCFLGASCSMPQTQDQAPKGLGAHQAKRLAQSRKSHVPDVDCNGLLGNRVTCPCLSSDHPPPHPATKCVLHFQKGEAGLQSHRHLLGVRRYL